MGIRRDRDGAEDAECAVAAGSAEWDQDLVEDRIIPPASTVHGAGIEVGEFGIIVPAANLVIAKPLAVAFQSIDLVPGLTDHEGGSVHRKIYAVVFVVAHRGIAVVDARRTCSIGP